MQKANLHQLATENKPFLDKSYEEVCSEIDSDSLQIFHLHCNQKCEVTSSIFSGFAYKKQGNQTIFEGKDEKHTEMTLSKILEKGKYLSAWEVFDDDEKCKQHFGKKGFQRIIFDETFEFGKQFKYLNLNNGQQGLPNWGNFTFAFPLSNFQSENFVFIKHNSLTGEKENTQQGYYFTADNKAVNISFLQKDLGNKEEFSKIVACKCQNELKTTNINYDLLFLKPIPDTKHFDYVEAIIWEDIEIKNATLRFDKGINDANMDAIANGIGKVLDDSQLRNFEELNNLINDYEENGLLAVELL